MDINKSKHLAQQFYSLVYNSKEVDTELLSNCFLDFIILSKSDIKFKNTFIHDLRTLCKNKQNQEVLFSVFDNTLYINDFSIKRINKILKNGTLPSIEFHGDYSNAFNFLIDFKSHFFLSHIYSLAFCSEKIFDKKFDSSVKFFEAINARSILGKQFFLENDNNYYFKMKEVNCSFFMIWNLNKLFSIDTYINNYYNARVTYTNYFIANLSYSNTPSETQKQILKYSDFSLSDINTSYNSIEKTREIISDNVVYLSPFNCIETNKYDCDDLYVLSLLALESTCGNHNSVYSFINYYLSSSDYISYPNLKEDILYKLLLSCFKKNGFNSFYSSLSFYDNYFNIILKSNLKFLNLILSGKKINKNTFKKALSILGIKKEEKLNNLYNFFSNLNAFKIFNETLDDKSIKPFYSNLFNILYEERYYNTLSCSVANELSASKVFEELLKVNKDLDKKETIAIINNAIEEYRINSLDKYNLSTKND